MTYLYLFCIIIYLLNIFVNGNTCKCAYKPNKNMCDNDMKISCDYGFQWVYYLQNIYDKEYGTIPFEIIGYILPICNNKYYTNKYYTNKCYAIGMIQYSYGYGNNRKSQKIINPISFDIYIPFTLQLKHNNNMYEIYRLNNSLVVNLPDIGKLTILDGRGLYPQGKKSFGYVKSGPGICDTAYSCSYIRTKIFSMNKQIGIGYGEFVKGTFMKNNKNLINWHCFYFHFEISFNEKYDIQACRSKWKNMKNDPYARMQIVYPNGSHKWYEGINSVKWTREIIYWTSPITNQTYQIGFQIYIPYIGYITTKPVNNNSEILNGLVKYSWIGSTKIYFKQQLVGIGITEVFQF